MEVITENRTKVVIYAKVLHPKSRGFIKLNSSDPLDYPFIFANYLKDKKDEDMMLYGIKYVLNFSQADAFKKVDLQLDATHQVGCEDYSFGTDDYWRCVVKHSYSGGSHQIGTFKMGPLSDEMAVVDSKLRVYGVRGLRVADCSIMPGVLSGNTHASAIMIGERVAEFLKEEWNC